MPELRDVLLFEVEGLSEQVRVLEFEGVEGISELFRFEVTLFAEAPIAFADVVGKPALLTIAFEPEGEPRLIHGMVLRFGQIDQGSEEAKNSLHYHATIVPRPYRLKHRNDSRIFQELTAVEVIKKVFDHAGLTSGTDYRLALNGTYTAREYCVQYRESDWDFACRLMEEEGILYFFEHKADKHVLVLGDNVHVHEDIAGTSTVIFRPPQGAMDAAESSHVKRFTFAQEVRPGKITIRDYDFKKPALLLESAAAGKTEAALELYDYPGDYLVPANGDAIAKIRLEEARAMLAIGEGEANVPRMISGAIFKLDEHLTESFNRKYLITRVEHRGRQPDFAADSGEGIAPYANHFEVIPDDIPFRPQRITHRPSVRGVQTAIVVGPAGEEIYTDEFGRVKVQFHWDRLGKKDEKSSCWIRVSQLWAGDAWGAIYIPRIKQEVVIAFEEGDPDRPLIVGRLYHGTNVVPYALPANKTRSTIKSRSTPNDEGSNELRFEDKKGSEEIFLHGQKDWTIGIENDKNQKIGHDETLDVKNDRTKAIHHDQKLKVDNDDTIEIGHDRTETIDHDETFLVKHDRKVTVNNDHTEQVDGNQTMKVVKNQTLEVDGNQAVTIKKNASLTIEGAQAVKITKDVSLAIDGAQSIKVAKDVSEEIGGAESMKIGKDASLTIDGAQTIKVTKDIKLEGEATYTIKVATKIVLECGAAKITIEKNGDITLEGKSLSLKGSGPVAVKGATVEVKSDATAKVEAGASMDLKAGGPLNLKGAMTKMDGSIHNIG